MRPRWLLVAGLAALVLTAGCLNAAEEIAETAGNATPVPDNGDANETSDPGQAPSNESRERQDPPSSDNGTGEEDGDRASEDGAGDEEDSGSNDAGETHPPWPKLGAATVRPGVQVVSDVGQCTSNFLFRTPDNATLMLGLAAHCFAKSPDAGDGCDSAVGPLKPGVTARVDGASQPATLVYNAWWTMQATDESNSDACRLNDFALVAIHGADRGSVHPAVKHYGGPTGLAGPGDASPGDKVLWFGNSGSRQGIQTLQRNEGYVTRDDGDWGLVMYSATPGIPGDSGSGVLASDGRALGVLSNIHITPDTGSNGVAALQSALAYANQHGVPAELVTWDLLDQGRLP